MKPILFLFLIFSAPVFGQTSKEDLAEALFTEEANGDLKGARKKYEALLESYQNERKIAAIALYRLAGIQIKEGNDEEAAKLYRQLIVEFPGVQPQQKLAREGLESLGLELPVQDANPVGGGAEERELAKLKKLAVTSPDVVVSGEVLKKAVDENWTRVIAYLLEKEDQKTMLAGFERAVSRGNLEMTRQFLDAGFDPNHEWILETAIENQYKKLVKLLLDRGGKIASIDQGFLIPKRTFPRNRLPVYRYAMELGVDPNKIDESARPKDSLDWDPNHFGIPLTQAVFLGWSEYVDLFLEHGADPNLVESKGDVSALHLAVKWNKPEIVRSLLKAGAKVDYVTTTPYDHRRADKSPQGISIGSLATPGSEIFFQLLENGAQFPEWALGRAAQMGSLKTVKALLENGSEINGAPGQKESESPLGYALRSGHFELAEYLRAQGATLTDGHWSFVSGDLAIKWNRELHYPKLAESGKVTLLFPEMNLKDGTMASLDWDGGIYQRLLNESVPTTRALFGKQAQQINYNDLKWNLVRDGQVLPIQISGTGFPALRKGDILEMVGLYQKGEHQKIYLRESRSLESRITPEFSSSLLKNVKMPLTVVVEGKAYPMIMMGGVAAYDPRSNELPYFPYPGELVNGLGFGRESNPFCHYEIRVVREGAPTATYQTGKTSPKPGAPLASGDRVEVIKVFEDPWLEGSSGQEKVPERSLRLERETTVRVTVSGSPVQWEWQTTYPMSKPTLLQALAGINRGCSLAEALHEEVSANPGRLDELDADTLMNAALTRRSRPAIAPAIDYSQIRIRRLVHDQPDQLLMIDLQAKMKEWDQGQRKEKSFDLELKGGDRVELVLKAGAWTQPSPLEAAYFQRGLSIPVSLKISDSDGFPGAQISGNLEVEPSKWIKSMGRVVPVIPGDARGEMLKKLNQLATIHVTRVGGDKEGAKLSRVGYFARPGDQIWGQLGGSGIGPNGIRYVPRPAE